MKKITRIILSMIICFLFFSLPVKADMGPKPSVEIEFEGLEGQIYYVTLLSEVASFGPNQVETEVPDYIKEQGIGDIYQKFIDYQEDYYFIGGVEECSETHVYRWGYYPPERFKVLIYLADKNEFIISDRYEQYTFTSMFKAHYDQGLLELEDNYDYLSDLGKLGMRMFITIIIEIIIAYFFNLINTKTVKYFIGVNSLTQILLNIVLYQFRYGVKLFIMPIYVTSEVIIMLIEAYLYYRLMKKEKSYKTYLTYSICANMITWIMGLGFLESIPYIF